MQDQQVELTTLDNQALDSLLQRYATGKDVLDQTMPLLDMSLMSIFSKALKGNAPAEAERKALERFLNGYGLGEKATRNQQTMMSKVSQAISTKIQEKQGIGDIEVLAVESSLLRVVRGKRISQQELDLGVVLINSMLKQVSEGADSIKPGAKAFNHLISSWYRNKDELRASQIIKRLEKIEEGLGDMTLVQEDAMDLLVSACVHNPNATESEMRATLRDNIKQEKGMKQPVIDALSLFTDQYRSMDQFDNIGGNFISKLMGTMGQRIQQKPYEPTSAEKLVGEAVLYRYAGEKKLTPDEVNVRRKFIKVAAGKIAQRTGTLNEAEEAGLRKYAQEIISSGKVDLTDQTKGLAALSELDRVVIIWYTKSIQRDE